MTQRSTVGEFLGRWLVRVTDLAAAVVVVVPLAIEFVEPPLPRIPGRCGLDSDNLRFAAGALWLALRGTQLAVRWIFAPDPDDLTRESPSFPELP